MPSMILIGDMHICPKAEGPKPHVGGPVSGPGATTVLVEGRPAAAKGDMLICVGPPDSINSGVSNVKLEGKLAASPLELTEHGGKIIATCTSVLIG